MKLRFIQTLSTPAGVFEAGKDYDVEAGDALRYINAGVANKAVEPSEPALVLPVATPTPLKEGEQIARAAAATADVTGRPRAQAVEMPKAPEKPSDNPAAFLHPAPHGTGGMPEPHTGFTTTEPDARTSPPSDGRSPLASHTAPEAIGNATVGSPAGAPDPNRENTTRTAEVRLAELAPEPEFAGHKLSEFDGKSDEQALALPGVTKAVLKQVRAEQQKRDAAKAK